jgi:hypothetical protein
MNDALKRPLVFGDKEQIEAIRFEQVRAEFKQLPECKTCLGSGRHECDCENCDGSCSKCDGSGREYQAYEEFCQRHPHTGFMLSELKRDA